MHANINIHMPRSIKLQTSYKAITDDYRRVTSECRRIKDEKIRSEMINICVVLQKNRTFEKQRFI